MNMEWFATIDIVWVEMSLLFLGIIFIIIALFRPKDNVFIEEKVENLLDDFITRVDMENEEIINKIKQSQQTPSYLNERLSDIEKRLDRVEQRKDEVPFQVNNKYDEVFKLFEAGESIDVIAKKTNIGPAEVKLILELSKKGLKYV